MKTSPEAWLNVIAPSRDHMVVAAEWMFTWDWLADWCAAEGLSFVLAHALSLQASHGGQATHDTLDAQKIAVLLRGGMLPQAYGYPAARRATRDRLRRRMPLAHKRGALLAHVQHTNRQDHLPAIGQNIADQAKRDGVAERFAAPAVHQSSDVDRSRIDYDAHRLGD
jgi:hypothetical protein